MQAGEESNMGQVDCHCEQPTEISFSASFVVAPNSINFQFVFSNWDPSNVGVLIACLALILLFIPCALFLRHMDKKDLLQVLSHLLYAKDVFNIKLLLYGTHISNSY